MNKLIFTLFIVLLLSCQKKLADPSDCPNYKYGTVVDMNGLDGCGFNIRLDDGNILEPTNLAAYPKVKINNQRIRFTYKEVDSIASICMVGVMVEITCAEGYTEP
ncbi:MAG: hypothetical protein ACK5UE_05885 [Chitinophagales bacterium]|jgi:hypothetical protein|nr:hypothetical protein [Sphingobacteriales bacterium]